MTSTARKLIYSKITATAHDGDDGQQEERQRQEQQISRPVIVLENLGASRWTDMVEVFRLVQHISCQNQNNSNNKNDATSSSSPLLPVSTDDSVKQYTSRTLGVPQRYVVHAVPVRRERQTNGDGDGDGDDDGRTDLVGEGRGSAVSGVPFDLLWHYGWSFSVLVPRQSSLDLCQRIREALVSYKPQGRRIERGSAAQSNNVKSTAPTTTTPTALLVDENDDSEGTKVDDDKEEEPITTLPATGIVATVEDNIPLRDIIQLYQAASPPVKLCGFPSTCSCSLLTNSSRSSNNNNKSNSNSINRKLLQNDFFLQTPELPGLFMLTNFLTEQDERELLTRVEEWGSSEKDQGPSCGGGGGSSWQNLNLRRVRHFGRRFDYSTNNVFAEKMIPLDQTPWIKDLLDRVHVAMDKSQQFEQLPDKEWNVDQMTVSEYKGGAGIPPHLDHPQNFGSIVVAVAVGAPTLFEFSKVAKSNEGDVKNISNGNSIGISSASRSSSGSESSEVPSPRFNNKCSVLFPPRALMVMQGPARYEWKHSIAARNRDYLFFDEKEAENCGCKLSACSLDRGQRISFTFRRVAMENVLSGANSSVE